MTDVVGDLARLSSLSSVPQVKRPIGRDIDLTPHEAYVASLIGTGVDIATVVRMSPLPEDQTLQFLARLVTLGLITVSPPR
jgi:hypothetical protein